MAITPIQYPPEAPHVPLGQKISALNAAADQSILTHQAIAEGGLKLKEARQNVADQAGLDAITASGGSDDDMLAKAMGISSSAYMTLREQLAKAHTAEQAQIKAKTDAQKSFFDLMGDRIQTIDAAPEENRPILWKHVVGTLKASGLPEAAQLPDQYDPNYSAQFSDAKAKLDAFSKTLENSIKSGKEMRDAAMAATDQADKMATRNKTEAETANIGVSPAMNDFNQSGYLQTYYKNHNIDPSTLNATTEAQHRGQAFTEFEQAKTNGATSLTPAMVIADPSIPNSKPISANHNNRTGQYTDLAGNILPNAVRYDKPTESELAVNNDAKDTAQGIINGKLPPTAGMVRTKVGDAVRAELARQGYDLSTATSDWNATQKHISTLNSQQQERLQQAISFTSDTLPQLEDAYAEWKKQAGVHGIKLFNKAALGSTKQFGGEAGSSAQQLESLIADFTSELGTVYKGGSSSTDESLKLAAQNLAADWNETTFNDAIKRLKKSIAIRQNSINSSTARGLSDKLPGGNGEVIDKDTARQFYDAAGKDPAKAKELAIQHGWKLE